MPPDFERIFANLSLKELYGNHSVSRKTEGIDPAWVVKRVGGLSDPAVQAHPKFFDKKVIQPANLLLQSKPGIGTYIPETYFDWRRDDLGKYHGYIIMRYIEGIDIENLDHISRSGAQSIEQVLLASLRTKIMDNCDTVFPDIVNPFSYNGQFHNIRLTEASLDESEKSYFIDVYPLQRQKFDEIRATRMHARWINSLEDLKNRTDGYTYPLLVGELNQGSKVFQS